VIAAILAGTTCNVLLGYVQVSSGAEDWRLYRFATAGSAVGFFSNRNHMGTLLVASMPLVATLLIAREEDVRRSLPRLIIGCALAVIILVGIAMNGSLAAVVLSVPVIAATVLLFGWTHRFRKIGLVAVAIGFVFAIGLTSNSSVQAKLTGTETSSIQSRQEIWKTSFATAKEWFPLGSGLGTFEHVYRLNEDPFHVTRRYVNHAHNDFLELGVEGGILALLLLSAFLIWWILRVAEAWTAGGNVLARAATIGSSAILAHSIVDYPARTSAIAAIFAFFIATLLMPRRRNRAPVVADEQQLWPTRHVVIQ
jgi:O-antigen ligase